MLIFLLIILLAAVVPDAIVWNAVFPTLGVGGKLLFGLPTLVMLGSMWATMTGRWGHDFSMRMFFGSILLLVVPKLVFALVAWSFGWKAGLAMALLLLVFFAYGFLFGWLKLKVLEVVLEFENLPPVFDGYKILQLSDFHIGTFGQRPEFVRKIVDTCNALKPDLIVFTGDLINVQGKEAEPFITELARLEAPDGVLSILGNHDYADLRSVIGKEQAMGWRLLMNEHVILRRGNESLSVIGVEQTGRPPFESKGRLKEALQGIPEGTFKVLLTHDPSHWRMEVLNHPDIALTLSGHTHAAQLRIGRFSPSQWMYREWGGLYKKGRQQLYVSLGIGGTVPFRLGAWPEVNLITLHPSP